MKKIISFLLVLFVAVVSNINSNAQDRTCTPGQVKFIFHIYDWDTGDPLQGVQMGVNANHYSEQGLHLGRPRLVNSGFSDSNGVAVAVAYYTPEANRGVFTTGKIYDSTTGFLFVNDQRFDCDPVNDSEYGWTTSQSGRVRNIIGGGNSTATNQGTHNDVILSGAWVAQGAWIEWNVYLKSKTNTVAIHFDKAEISNASSFPHIDVTRGSNFNVSSVTTTPLCTDPNYVFDYWTLDGTSPFISATINSSITLKPVWKPVVDNPDAVGIIKFKVFLWDHDKYDLNPNSADYGFNYTHTLTGVNGNTVKSNYANSKYLINAGWTNIPVSGLRFTLRTYIEASGVPRNPVGIGEITTDENGEATLTLNKAQLNALNIGYVIDTDPDPNCLASLIRKPDYGREYCSFNWDWVAMSNVQGAGAMGVRYIKEGTRHDDLGIQLCNWNDNDAMLLTRDDIFNGFEFTFYCYVTAAPCAMFEVNGGVMPSGYNENLYPLQKFTPLNSAGVEVEPWVVTNPGSPSKAGLNFAGWHEVRTTYTGAEYIDPNPFDFTKTIDRSIVLRAIYVGETYNVRWAPEDWDGTNESALYEKYSNVEDGTLPTYNKNLPAKTNAEFVGWDLYMKSDIGDKTFGSLGQYVFVKTLKQPKSSSDTGADFMSYIETQMSSFWQSPVAMDMADQIYVAKFNQFTMLTVTKSGLKAGDSAVFTISNGTETRKIVLTGNTAGTAVSKTLYLDAGTWTVTEEMGWSWAYENSTSSKNVTIADGAHETVTFTNSPKSTTPQHGESSVNNTFSE